MKTKQTREESDKNLDEDLVQEPKTRARKKASDTNDEDKSKPSQDEAKSSRETKKPAVKAKALVKKRPLGIRKTLRNKKVIISKDKLKNVPIRPGAKRGRKTTATAKSESVAVPIDKNEKESIPMIPASDIKKEPIDETSPNSRSSSPKTTGRRQRLSFDMMLMKSVLADTPSSLVLGPRTSPYSMRSERSNSPSILEGKNLRSGKPRKVKSNLLNEVVLKEQKKRSRLLSDSKANDSSEGNEECKKLKRGRSCSRDGSEISKCSDVTESDISLSETFSNDTDMKELNKKLDKTKTDLDVDIENSVQISTIEKVPSLMFDSKPAAKTDMEPSSVLNKKIKKKESLKRSTSLDSDNNNGSNRVKLDNLHSSLDMDDKRNSLLKTDNDTLFSARSSILTSMSKTFNSKEVSKNIRKARQGRKAAAAAKSTPPQTNIVVSTCISNDVSDEKNETLENLSKEIDNLITNLDQTIDHENNVEVNDETIPHENTLLDTITTKTVNKFYGISKPLCDNNSIIGTSDIPLKEKDTIGSVSSPSKHDDSENILLHYDEDSEDKSVEQNKQDSYTCNVASIDKLMDRLKEFEEFDKRRQRQESESKNSDSKQVMVSNDVVLIPKSGADIKPLKDIQSVRSPEKPLEKENVLSCFENNSAISIVKRDHVRKSIDVDLPNSVTLIKRNSISRKESTGSNNSKESNDAISIFEKSFGKDVTLTEIRKSVDKTIPNTPVDTHQYATLHPNNSSPNIGGVVIDSKQISITPRGVAEIKSDTPKRRSIDLSRKSSESGTETDSEKPNMENIISPIQGVKSPSIIATTPVAVKSPESLFMDTDPVAPALETVKDEDLPLTGVPVIEESRVVDTNLTLVTDLLDSVKGETPVTENIKSDQLTQDLNCELASQEPKIKGETEVGTDITTPPLIATELDSKIVSPNMANIESEKKELTESQLDPSIVLTETPERQENKMDLMLSLGLLTLKAAKDFEIEKLKEKERIYQKNKASKSSSTDYTGTLKTVIKLNRGTGDRDKKKYRSSLKITFQKSKNRSGKPAMDLGETAYDDDAYYTIERKEGTSCATADGGHRKSYSNRLNNYETEPVEATLEPAKEPTINLVIPEKASSFSIHPGRLCMDQCFYCGGKFGLFDTPCHIAQMKSSERQKKVLDNEEKLTIDSCLCDACYRHVDRRANCPSYRKRIVMKPISLDPSPLLQQAEKPLSPPGDREEESEEEPTVPPVPIGRPTKCHTEGCMNPGEQSIRRKWLIKMRSCVNKLLTLEGDYPGLHTIPLCSAHYRLLMPLLACNLCRVSITKHHNVHLIHEGYLELNPLLKEAGIPVTFTERPVLCKMCRYYCNVLHRCGHNDKHARRYRRRLLQIHNIAVPPESDYENEMEMSIEEDKASGLKQKKKTKTKSKQRRSTEHDKTGESADLESSNEQTDSQKAVSEDSGDGQKHSHMEEDIESLISSNKIMVPGASKPNNDNCQSDGSEGEAMMEIDPALMHLDKQTELQYLLQKQNNPAQFLHKPNAALTNKQRGIMKTINMSLIHKPGQQQRIAEKNAKRIHKLGQIITQKEKTDKSVEVELFEAEKPKDSSAVIKNITLNDECTIETIPNKKPADITTLKNKWQMSESFSQVKKNLSELSKKLTVDKIPKKLSEFKYSNPVKRLETNPSISVRELFPGEEEMNLQCNIEFNNVKGVTPEGWEKCSATIQYDVETKRLWNELQRPYGNQSSFLRHLVILEKYFRSGDLVLSQSATPHAANYSDSVQSRLRAYDNIASDAPRRAEPAISLIEFRKPKPSMNGKSLLKSSQNQMDVNKLEGKKIAMPPPGAFIKPKPSKECKSKTKPLPPELIAINTPNAQGRKAIENVLQNIQKLVKGVSASDPTEVAAAPLPLPPPPPPSLPLTLPLPPVQTPVKTEPPKEKKEKSDTPKKHKSSSKPWRPTLMPITQENLSKIEREPLQVAVDGRRLPSLVQVMSSGKKYHITIEDYNKMCIMRRDKLQQLQDGTKQKKATLEVETTMLVTEIQPSALLGNGGTVKQMTPEKTDERPKTTLADLSQMGNAATILKNVGLKNITIAPIPAKTATVTSHTASPSVSSPTSLVTSASIKIPQLGSSVSITSETVLTPTLPAVITSIPTPMLMPKIPKSLTVIPQTVMPMAANPQMITQVLPAAAVPSTDSPRP